MLMCSQGDAPHPHTKLCDALEIVRFDAAMRTPNCAQCSSVHSGTPPPPHTCIVLVLTEQGWEQRVGGT